MPELSLQSVLLVVCVGLFTSACAAWDLRTRKIPNKLTLPVFFAGWVYQLAFGGWAGMLDGLQGFAVGFGVLFALWLIGGGGGGDVKLMGALSVWLGFRMTLMVLSLSVVFVVLGTGGVIAFNLVTRGLWRTREKFVAGQAVGAPFPTVDRQNRRIMAYALPVALATWLVLVYMLPRLP